MAATAPAHFFRVQAIGLFLRRHGRLRRRQFRILVQRLRHQRYGLRSCRKCRDTGGHTYSDLEKFPAFHDSLLQSRVMRTQHHRAAMNTC